MPNNFLINKSKALAHIFISIIKADSEISKKEMANLSYYASKSADKLNIYENTEKLKQNIKNDIQILINNHEYNTWESKRHINEAINILKKIKQEGDFSVKIIFEQIEEFLVLIAQSDSYLKIESDLIKKIKERLKKI